MLFNSTIFIAFAVLFFSLWPLAKRRNSLRWSYLVIASFIFYGWWDWRFLFLIIGSGLLDFFAGLGMAAHPRRKLLLLIASVLGNLGSLMIFKYSGFVAESLDALFSFLRIDVSLRSDVPPFMLILPIGISFYTFQSMSYTIDIYRGQLKPTRNILHFFAYLSMFPQLVAGPIIRARDLLPQLKKFHCSTEQQRWSGMKLIIQGYFKKVVIADNLAPVVSMAFSATKPLDSSCYWWCIITAFAIQIYCDFSGYSDIARGLAKWMGYDFALNFNHPYMSKSLQEFWTRWHISLSTWFRDYVYISLGGSRKGKWCAHGNMWIAMLLSGLWHGAAWNFVVWGLLHAVFLSVERITKWPNILRSLAGGKALSLFMVTIQVWVAWVFFRAETLAQAMHILRIMFSFTGKLHSGLGENGIVFIVAALFGELFVYFRFKEKLRLSPVLRGFFSPLLWALLAVACVYLRGPGSEFIYFQF